MKIKTILSLLIVTPLTVMNAQNRRSNPIVSHMFTADPSAHVWEDGRLYVYPSTDVAPASGYKTMDGYHVFSTDDMITWKDHGEILNSSQVEWGRKEGGFMWAPDCAYKNGTYFYYFPHPSGTDFQATWKIGVATSKKPASDFKVQGYIKGLESLIDPCVFVDDDGQAYLYHGGPDVAHGYKLKENMMEIEGERHIIEGLEGFREGLFIFKRKGIYYAMYPDGTKGANQMRYGMSDNPFGPFKFKDVFLGSTDVITTHGSAVEYKGQWYIFYHNGNLSGGIGPNRSVCFDLMTFNDDGTINMVNQTLGVQLPTFHKEKNFNEVMGTLAVGNYKQKDLKKQNILPMEISSIEIPKGYAVQVFEKDNFSGKSWHFEEDRIDLNELGCDDRINSVKVTKVQMKNLAKNPSFELATQKQLIYWLSKGAKSYEQYRDDFAKGYYSLRFKSSKSEKEITQNVEIKPNTNYELSVKMKIDKGTSGKVIFDTNGFNGIVLFELDASKKAGEWVAFKGTFNSGDNSKVQLRALTSTDFNGTCYWDDVVLEEK